MTHNQERISSIKNKKLLIVLAAIVGLLAYIQINYALTPPCSSFGSTSELDHAQAALYVSCHK